jgi:DhnA family fructose-bisphosphate aldolase class Ia
VLKYAPPLSAINQKTTRKLLFVREAAPYSVHPGGDAFYWKEPSLEPGQIVAICRCGDVMSPVAKADCLMSSVGSIEHPLPNMAHMGAYVVRLSSRAPDKLRWRVEREAKPAERLFCTDEVATTAACDDVSAFCVLTQVNKPSAIKLLKQIAVEQKKVGDGPTKPPK